MNVKKCTDITGSLNSSLSLFLTECSGQCEWLSECDDGGPWTAVSDVVPYTQQDATGRKWSVITQTLNDGGWIFFFVGQDFCF